jgi:hypothetical protein
MSAQSNIEDRIFAQEFQDEFWPSWPVKTAKLAAEKAYIRARRGDKDAVEIYPADKDIVNVANMRHLIVLPAPFPYTWR